MSEHHFTCAAGGSYASDYDGVRRCASDSSVSEPCWGRLQTGYDGGLYCSGHDDGGPYKREPGTEDDLQVQIEAVADRVKWRYAYFGDSADGGPRDPECEGGPLAEDVVLVVSQEAGQGPFAVGPVEDWHELIEISTYPWANWAPLSDILRATREQALEEGLARGLRGLWAQRPGSHAIDAVADMAGVDLSSEDPRATTRQNKT